MPRMNLGRVRDKLTKIEQESQVGRRRTYEMYSELNPNGFGSFYVEDGETGQPAGFGSITYNTETVTRESGTDATAVVMVTTNGPNEAKNMNFAFQFAIPRGANGVVTDSSGVIGFQVINGVLYATTSEDSPDLHINSDGQLVFDFGE